MAIQTRTEQLLFKELQNRLSNKAHGRNLWTPLRPTINDLNTVGVGSGSVLDIEYDYDQETEASSG